MHIFISQTNCKPLFFAIQLTFCRDLFIIFFRKGSDLHVNHCKKTVAHHLCALRHRPGLLALMAICAWISIPTAVPFTLQTFAVFLVTGLLGLKCGTLSVLVYLLLGAVGLPVFTGFKGGIGALLGTTGGYLVGFVFIALTVGLLTKFLGRSLPVLICSMALGMIFVLRLRVRLVPVSVHHRHRSHFHRLGAVHVRFPLSGAGRDQNSAGRLSDPPAAGAAEASGVTSFAKIGTEPMNRAMGNAWGASECGPMWASARTGSCQIQKTVLHCTKSKETEMKACAILLADFGTQY